MNMFEVMLGEMLAGAARLALSLDEDHQQHLARLEGHSLCIACTNPPQRVTLRVAAGALDVLPGSNNPTDATVTGSLNDLFNLLRGATEQQSLHVQGDVAVLRNFSRLFEQYNPDFRAIVPEALRDTAGKPPFNNTDQLFDTLRGFAEVGFQSVGKALQTALQSGQEQVRAAAEDRYVDEDAFAAATARLHKLQDTLSAVQRRVAALEPEATPPK